MALRWTAAGMLEAEGQFRKVIGYRQLAKLAVAIEREIAISQTTREVASLIPA
jgi:putative transposase